MNNSKLTNKGSGLVIAVENSGTLTLNNTQLELCGLVNNNGNLRLYGESTVELCLARNGKGSLRQSS